MTAIFTRCRSTAQTLQSVDTRCQGREHNTLILPLSHTQRDCGARNAVCFGAGFCPAARETGGCRSAAAPQLTTVGYSGGLPASSTRITSEIQLSIYHCCPQRPWLHAGCGRSSSKCNLPPANNTIHPDVLQGCDLHCAVFLP